MDSDQGYSVPSTRIAFGGFWVLLCLGTIFVGGPWAGFHGILLGGAGLLMAVAPPSVRLPRSWWILTAVFITASAACFLPAAWFETPAWRGELEKLGLETGSRVVIQSRQAAETLALFALMLLTGLWIAGHRATAAQVRCWALAFTVGVATYAVFAKIMQDPEASRHAGQFGFFPNRNHTATYLAMGTVCGLGCGLQAIRDKRFYSMGLAFAATSICLWAVVGWSISRAGVVLVAVGSLAWLSMLGRHYLGRHGLWAIGLFSLTAIGLFFIVDSHVKDRLSSTLEQAAGLIGPESIAASDTAKPPLDSAGDLDFRIPVARDTLGMIREFPWTGIGPGQYYYVFPQYRKRTLIAQDADSYHPESDWLWMASETGILSTLALLALVILAFRKSLVGVLRGRDRALRSACLVAALIVPFHGLFDVPGHRITLAWSAAFLFTLSLHPPAVGLSDRPPATWPFRVLSLVWIAAAVFGIRGQWWGGPELALSTAQSAITEARHLYDEDQVLQKAAASQNKPYQPDPAEDRLEKALAILEKAGSVAPLDRDLLRYQAFLAFHFDDKYSRIDQWFALDRALDPTWVGGPLRQAQAWSNLDPQKTSALWSEALLRASQVDHLQRGNHWSREKTHERIRQFANGKPEIQSRVPALE